MLEEKETSPHTHTHTHSNTHRYIKRGLLSKNMKYKLKEYWKFITRKMRNKTNKSSFRDKI